MADYTEYEKPKRKARKKPYGKVISIGQTSDYSTGDAILIVAFKDYPHNHIHIVADADEEEWEGVLSETWKKLEQKSKRKGYEYKKRLNERRRRGLKHMSDNINGGRK